MLWHLFQAHSYYGISYYVQYLNAPAVGFVIFYWRVGEMVLFRNAEDALGRFPATPWRLD